MMEAIAIEITEHDVRSAVGQQRATEIKQGDDAAHLGGGRAKRLAESLPEIVSWIMTKAAPSGFALSKIELLVQIKGEPFGVGTSGQVKIEYTREV